ncbi:MAG: glycoside hydrolase family 3 N-terminal domain-containing protein, partial [Pseudomonadota bacterium]
IARPRGKPEVAEIVASSCERADPHLTWALLPPSLRTVPLRQMIGQLLVISYSDTTPRASGVEAVRQAIRSSRVGGVLTFRHNISSGDNIRAINEAFRDAHPVLPAIVAVDQEGGAVMRVKPSEGGPDTPSAKRVADGTLEEARTAYTDMARALADLGFTVNFGPVVDLEVNPKNPVIARFGRAYSASAEEVVKFAQAFIDAHSAAGLGTALKHFPGHGSSTADSHEGAIDLSATWSHEELIPFRELIDSGSADMVMIGHLKLEGVTGPDNLPASLSPKAIDGVLREALCFDGVVVSDDLAMDAVSNTWGAVEATRLMVEAGGDMALLSIPAGEGFALIDEITDALVAEAERSPEFLQKIKAAYARIVHFKLDLSELTEPRSDAAVPTELADAAGAVRTK